jgi:radical SAM protein (TIGR01212 family)
MPPIAPDAAQAESARPHPPARLDEERPPRLPKPPDGPSPDWLGKPYYPISAVYKQRFGGKVVKIPVAIADNCPNRAGLKGMRTCIFCDDHGSFAYPESQGDELSQQLVRHREKVSQRFNATRFLVYFQAYTTTFGQLGRLRAGFDLALAQKDVAGLVVGTRPDCLSQGVLSAWKEYGERTYLAVELGVQSFDDEQLLWMRRGHDARQSIAGIERVARETGVEVGIHLIFGWPTESDKQLVETARLCNELPISSVKLHNLHVLKGTPLADLYARGAFEPLELDEYARRVSLFLESLSPRIAIHRLAALSSSWDELIAPAWTRHKMKSYQAIIDWMNARGARQGAKFAPRPIA